MGDGHHVLLITLALTACAPDNPDTMTADFSSAASASAALFAEPNRRLAEAAARGDAGAIAGLVASGADPNAVNREHKPLMLLAVEARSLSAFNALLAAGANPAMRLPNGQVVLQYLVQHEDPAYLKAALDAGADPGLRNGNDEPMIYHAAMWNRWEALTALVEAGADVNAPAHGDAGETVLAHYAMGQWDKVHWLMQHGARADHSISAAPEGHADRIGAKPVLESIFWRDVDPQKFPELAAAQQKVQALALEQGYEKPPEPRRFRDDRERRLRGG